LPPLENKYLSIGTCPNLHATISAVDYELSHFCSISAPLLVNISTHFKLPLLTARYSGVTLQFVTEFTFAPLETNN
jgi:hypothetical protein